MLIDAASASALPDLDYKTEAAMLRTLGSILRSGTLRAEQAEALASAASDRNIDAAASCFAVQALRWLAQQSTMVTTPIWERSSDARH